MARIPPPQRRASLTRTVPVVMSGKEVKIHVTVGFSDDAMTNPIEVFCADFKAGSDSHAIVMDACILFSRLLQNGEGPMDLAKSLAHPLLVALAKTIAEINQ